MLGNPGVHREGHELWFLLHQRRGVCKQEGVVSRLLAQRVQVGLDPLGDFVGRNLRARQLVVDCAEQAIDRAFAFHCASKVHRQAGHVVAAQAGIQALDVGLIPRNAAGHNLPADLLLAGGHQFLGSEPRGARQVFQVTHLAAHGLEVHHFAQCGIFAGRQSILGMFQGLACALGIGEVLVGFRLCRDALDEGAQRGGEVGQVGGNGERAVQAHRYGGQALHCVGHHGGSFGRRGLIPGQVLLKLLPPCDQLGTALWLGLVPQRVRALWRAVACREQRARRAADQKLVLQLQVVVRIQVARLHLLHQLLVQQLVFPDHFVHQVDAVKAGQQRQAIDFARGDDGVKLRACNAFGDGAGERFGFVASIEQALLCWVDFFRQAGGLLAQQLIARRVFRHAHCGRCFRCAEVRGARGVPGGAALWRVLQNFVHENILEIGTNR